MCKMVDWFALRDIKLDQLLSGSNRTKMLEEKWHDWAGHLRCEGIYITLDITKYLILILKQLLLMAESVWLYY